MAQAAHQLPQSQRRASRLPSVLRTVAAPAACMTREAFAWAVESGSLSDELRGLNLGGGAGRAWA